MRIFDDEDVIQLSLDSDGVDDSADDGCEHDDYSEDSGADSESTDD